LRANLKYPTDHRESQKIQHYTVNMLYRLPQSQMDTTVAGFERDESAATSDIPNN